MICNGSQAAKTDLSTSTYAVGRPPEKWRHSTVSKFGVRYSPPVWDLNLDHSVETLVEGSDMSMVHEGAVRHRLSCRSIR